MVIFHSYVKLPEGNRKPWIFPLSGLKKSRNQSHELSLFLCALWFLWGNRRFERLNKKYMYIYICINMCIYIWVGIISPGWKIKVHVCIGRYVYIYIYVCTYINIFTLYNLILLPVYYIYTHWCIAPPSRLAAMLMRTAFKPWMDMDGWWIGVQYPLVI